MKLGKMEIYVIVFRYYFCLTSRYCVSISCLKCIHVLMKSKAAYCLSLQINCIWMN